MHNYHARMQSIEAAIGSNEAGPARLRAACAGLDAGRLNRRIAAGDCPPLLAFDENAFVAQRRRNLGIEP
jgi:hypothetical protein